MVTDTISAEKKRRQFAAKEAAVVPEAARHRLTE